ncbi:MAG TPA: hypothetical protein VIY72_13465 [Acidimicrobiales bacterium]
MSPALPSPRLDRRAFLRRTGMVGGLGALALGAPTLLSACGGSDSGSSDGDQLSLSEDLDGRQLVGFFNYTGDYLEAGTPQRLVLAVATAEGPPDPNGPDTLAVQLALDGSDVGAPIELARHADGVPIGYYPLLTTFERSGDWTVTSELDGQEVSQSFRVEDNGGSPIRQVGQAMVPVTTPTVMDGQGITPICTRSPQCPFHDHTLADVLAGGGPVALMISTPQYCQTGVCGPVLDLVMEQATAQPEVRVVHAEVYVDPAKNGSDPAAGGLAPVVEAYGLTFEPSLFVARADGTIVGRLDNVFDRVELARAFQAALA